MAQSDILGLFGLTPEALQQSQAARDRAEALQFAQLSPMDRASFGFYQAGQQLGRGVGSLLGIEDPQLRMITQQQQILRGVDPNDPESLAQGARNAAQMGNAALAAALSQQANALAAGIAQRQANQASVGLREGQLASLQLTQARENQLQNALSQLPENASEDQIQNVLRRYGDPKMVLQALERKSLAESQAQERARMQKERDDRMAQERERDREFKLMLANLSAQQRSATGDLQRQLIQERIDGLKAKQQEKIDKQMASAEGVVRGTDVVLSKIDEAQKLLGKTTTGLGSYLSVIPGTDARALSSTLGTIKARLGFDQLQQMRDASPTGGALGQVAVKELEALQSAIASLDQGLDRKTLDENLKQIKSSYQAWRNAALGKSGNAPAPTQSPTPTAQPMQAPAASAPSVVNWSDLSRGGMR